MTKAVALIALTCLLVAGAAATSILGRDSVPLARQEITTPIGKGPVANRASKQDRMTVVSLALPPSSRRKPRAERDAEAGLCIHRAGRYRGAEDHRSGAHPAGGGGLKPKLAAKPPLQKNYALLSDVQIAGIKERLRLSSDQEYYWPAVENALRAVARKIHATRQSDPHATGAPIDPDAAEVQQLKSAAMPLLFQLREDQKQEVRKLARIIGLEKVAAQI